MTMSLAWVLAGFMAVAACRGDGSAAKAGLTINASGSTFQQPYQEVAIEAFTRSHPGIAINYGGGGSGKGRQDLADRVVELAGTDEPFSATELANARGGPILYFPVMLGPIAVCYHVPGIQGLRLSPETLAKIFQRDVTRWNDPAIAADNPGVTLPDLGIVVAHRADGSGTTANFTKYLALAAPKVWRLESASTVEWPPDSLAGPGNGGVAQIIQTTNGAIGYVDLSDAKAAGLVYAAIENRAGVYVMPSAASSSAAGAGISVQPNLLFRALDAPGRAAYPITYQTWVVVYAHQADPVKGAVVKDYVRFLVTDGQKLLPDLDFAPLPAKLQAQAIAQLDQIKT